MNIDADALTLFRRRASFPAISLGVMEISTLVLSEISQDGPNFWLFLEVLWQCKDVLRMKQVMDHQIIHDNVDAGQSGQIALIHINIA